MTPKEIEAERAAYAKWFRETFGDSFIDRTHFAVGLEAWVASRSSIRPAQAAEPEQIVSSASAKRLRQVCRLLGLENAIPQSNDAELLDVLFPVLGMVRAKIERLQAAPQAAEERKPLSEDEISEITGCSPSTPLWIAILAVVRATETFHGIKGD